MYHTYAELDCPVNASRAVARIWEKYEEAKGSLADGERSAFLQATVLADEAVQEAAMEAKRQYANQTSIIMKYRKKPATVEAVLYDGHNKKEIEKLAGRQLGEIFYDGLDAVPESAPARYLVIPTPEGNMGAAPGDYILKGPRGELRPCRPWVFERNYEPIKDRAEESPTANDKSE